MSADSYIDLVDVHHEAVIISLISFGSSLFFAANLKKELSLALVLDVVDELPLCLMVKSMFSLSVVAELESLELQHYWEPELGSLPGNNHDHS